MTGLTQDTKTILPTSFFRRIWNALVRQQSAMKKLGIWEVGPYDMSGKVIFITGGNGGIGFETAKALCGFGAAVVIGCRNVKAGEDAVKKIQVAYPNAKISMVKMDLADVNSLKAVIPALQGELKKLGQDRFDVILLNAALLPTKYSEINGVEIGFAVNALGNYVLCELLIKNKLSKKRIVTVTGDIYIGSSNGDSNHDFKDNWAGDMSYNKSKLGLNWIMMQFQKKYRDHDFVLLHPGVINTNLVSGAFMDVFKSLVFLDGYHGAQMSLFCVCEKNVLPIANEAYYHNTYGVAWFDKTDPMMKEKRPEEVFKLCQDLAKI